MNESVAFSLEPGGRPSVAIRACVEICLSIRVGDDADRLHALWTQALDAVRGSAHHVHHNGPGGEPRLAGVAHADEIRSALHAACAGPDAARPIPWGALGYVDAADSDVIPRSSATLAFGWIREPLAPRGLMVRVTGDVSTDWSMLTVLAEAAAVEPCMQWITVGYRFVTVPWSSSLLAEALQVIHHRSRRFRGVDIGDPLEVQASTWQYQLRTVSWITVVSDRLAATAPPPEGTLPPWLSCRRLDAARWYRAGEAPSLGDVNCRDRAEAYMAIDQWLTAARPPRAVHFLPPWTELESQHWMERFARRDAAASSG